MAAKKNEQHPLRIEGYGSAGEGVARLEGQAVFVKGALAGEICQVQPHPAAAAFRRAPP